MAGEEDGAEVLEEAVVGEAVEVAPDGGVAEPGVAARQDGEDGPVVARDLIQRAGQRIGRPPRGGDGVEADQEEGAGLHEEGKVPGAQRLVEAVGVAQGVETRGPLALGQVAEVEVEVGRAGRHEKALRFWNARSMARSSCRNTKVKRQPIVFSALD